MKDPRNEREAHSAWPTCQHLPCNRGRDCPSPQSCHLPERPLVTSPGRAPWWLRLLRRVVPRN